MSKNCARCEKTVYPTEELKCLDKVWHKWCFKCKECGMTLNMRNYKGFNKEPYCEAHIPKAQATTMADTPELKRIAANTMIQSNVKYHADFEKSKGKFTQVADDPETLRIKQNTRIISNVTYHGELERKALMEQRRQLNENGNTVNMGGYTPSHTPVQHLNNVTNPTTTSGQELIYTSEKGQVEAQQRHIGSVHDMDPVNHNYGSLGRVYRALYDYEAQDDDEVSFHGGDFIINVRNIDSGWMTGEIQRTGQVGMLPANYVQIVNI